MRGQMDRLNTIREPLAAAVRALTALDPTYQHLADELTHLWEWPDVARVIGETTIYRVDYAAHLVMENVEELIEAAIDPAKARVLSEHLPSLDVE